jgi:hypothetical protein
LPGRISRRERIFYGLDNVTVSYVSAIPEPSTYAAIFGAVAFGLAAWRRQAGARGMGATRNAPGGGA